MDNGEVENHLARLSAFTGERLTSTVSELERTVVGVTGANSRTFLTEFGAHSSTLNSAAVLKKAIGQINVSIHALGILRCLPHILLPNETVLSVSLGAGNTGREFDLETDLRVAEFKFISWKGGAESIRQNSIFKDYFNLAESKSSKLKFLYVLGTEFPLKFFNGGRAMGSVLSKDARTQRLFSERFGETYATVREYFAAHSHLVEIVDVSAWLPELASVDLE